MGLVGFPPFGVTELTMPEPLYLWPWAMSYAVPSYKNIFGSPLSLVLVGEFIRAMCWR